MDIFIKHANHNMGFHTKICSQYPDEYYDWKIICLFYIAIHYLKSLSLHRQKIIGDRHSEINVNIRKNGRMPLAKTARDNYLKLFEFSQSARYEGIDEIEEFNRLQKTDYGFALKCFWDFEKYIISNGVKIK